MTYTITYSEQLGSTNKGVFELVVRTLSKDFESEHEAIAFARAKGSAIEIHRKVLWSYEEEQEKIAKETADALTKLIEELGADKALNILKRKGKPTVKVDIIESESGWGQKVDETKEFDTREEAEAFCKEYNAQNDKKVTPGWYMYARIA